MPDNQTPPPADGQQGEGGQTPPAGTPPANPGGQTPPASVKTFTQEELDAIVQARVARATPADYDALKQKAAEYDKAQEAGKSDLEKAQAAAAKAEKERDEAISRANATLIRAALTAEAASQNAVDPDTVVALLASDASVTISDDGSVAGAKEAVKALLKAKPFLGKGAPASGGRPSGGEFGGADNETLVERIASLERAGKFAEARELKLQQMAGIGTS